MIQSASIMINIK